MISARLREIAWLVPPGSRTIDVGTDHGYLPVLIRRQDPQARVAASDIAERPLRQARHNLEQAGFGDVELYLSDGLEQVPDLFDTAVITGMGAQTIIGILETALKRGRRLSCLVLGPNRDPRLLREWLVDNGYAITAEKMIRDGHYYELIRATPGAAALNEEDLTFGPCLRQERPEAFIGYWRREAAKLRMIIRKLPEKHPDREGLERQLSAIERELSRPESH